MLGFFKRGNALVTVNRPFAGIVGGQCPVLSLRITRQQKDQVPRPCFQVLLHVMGGIQSKACAGVGHHLHQTHRAFGRDGLGMVARFYGDNGVQQRGV